MKAQSYLTCHSWAEKLGVNQGTVITNPHLIQQVSGQERGRVRGFIASMNHPREARLQKLAHIQEPHVSLNCLRQLCFDKDKHVREAAINRALTTCFMAMSKVPEVFVYEPFTSEDTPAVLKSLATEQLKLELKYGDRINQATLEHFTHNPVLEVRNVARERLFRL